jgi:hypothetical protein
MALLKFDSKEMCHYHTCQNHAESDDPPKLCKMHRESQVNVDAFLEEVRRKKSAIVQVQAPVIVIDIQSLIAKSEHCYICFNCRRLHYKPSVCCDYVNLICIETKSIVRDARGGIVECRQAEYSRKSS